MLFMSVYSFPPANRNEVIKRRMVLGPQTSDKVKVVGEWSYVGSGKVFRLIDATDPEEVYKLAYPWTDLGTLETYPVMPVEEIMKMASTMMR